MKAHRRKRGKSSARRAVLIVIGALTIAGGVLSPSPMSALAAGATLAALVLLLWRDTDPPILLLPVTYQWSVVAVKPILSIMQNRPLNALADFGGNIEQAAYFGFAGVAALALGMRLGGRLGGQDHLASLRAEARAWKPRPLFIASLLAIAAGHLLTAASSFAGPARQPMLAMGGLTFIGLFALSYWCLATRKGYPVLAAVMAFEIVIGMTGFFASFREPMLIFGLAAITARPTVKLGDLAIVGLAGAMLLSAAIFWTSVKAEYREFVNEGTGAQVVTVPFEDRISHLAEAAQNFGGAEFASGFDRLLRRHSYIDFLANTMWHVPSNVPHENGARLGQSLLHIVTPRIFFPNKPPAPFDSDVTAHYTGLATNLNPNASISIGYLGELYIDFGVVGALVAALVLGWIAGLGYRTLSTVGKGSLLFVYGLCAYYALQLATFETALIKILGGTVISFIGAMLIKRFILPTLLSDLAPKAKRRKRVSGGGEDLRGALDADNAVRDHQ